jgi:hypothetical protein
VQARSVVRMIFLMRNGHLRGESGLRWGANHCNMERF